VPGIVIFEVVIKNPCSESEGVTIDSLQFDYPTPTIEFGQSTTVTWVEPGTSVDLNLGSVGKCGQVTFDVFTDEALSTRASWVEFESDTSIKLATAKDTSLIGATEPVKDVTLYVKKTLVDWSVSSSDRITVTITNPLSDRSTDISQPIFAEDGTTVDSTTTFTFVTIETVTDATPADQARFYLNPNSEIEDPLDYIVDLIVITKEEDINGVDEDQNVVVVVLFEDIGLQQALPLIIDLLNADSEENINIETS